MSGASLPEVQIVEEFRARRKRQLIATVPAVLALLCMSALPTAESVFGVPTSVISVAAIITLLGFIVFSHKNWRCPGCDRSLGRDMNPSFCSKCGVKLKA